MLRFFFIRFFYLFVSVEEMDDSPDSGSDFEVELKAKKRGKMAVAAPKVNNLILSSFTHLNIFQCDTKNNIRWC